MSIKKPVIPNCPMCGNNRNAIARADGQFYCKVRDHGLYDRDSNEGGDYSDRNPAARLERAERQQQRRRR